MTFQPIGIIHTPFLKRDGMPIQPPGAVGIQGTVEVFEPFQSGLKDLDGFSHVILLYHFHQARGCDLQVIPFMDTEPRGLFATRAPKRPNPIGLSVVRLLNAGRDRLRVENIDVLDGTPLLDIKPYVPAFDAPPADRFGWLASAQARVKQQQSDRRFS
jgi:tRNA (adenine37-N6)-methyltransferase